MDEVSDPVDDKLKSASGPEMPPDVESRIRARIHAGLAAKPRRAAPPWQILALAVLLLVAGWVAVHNIVPFVQSAWEKLCAPAIRK